MIVGHAVLLAPPVPPEFNVVGRLCLHPLQSAVRHPPPLGKKVATLPHDRVDPVRPTAAINIESGGVRGGSDSTNRIEHREQFSKGVATFLPSTDAQITFDCISCLNSLPCPCVMALLHRRFV